MARLDGDQLARRLEEVYGEIKVAGTPRRLSSGASRETWLGTTTGGDDFVVQIRRGATATAEYDEAELLRAAAEAGVPVPRVLADGADDPVLGTYVVTNRVAGTEDPRVILGGEGVPDAESLIEDLARALARVHEIDIDASGLQPADPLALVRGLYDFLGQPHPIFELAFRRLETNRPAPNESTVVHADFRIGNLLVDETGLTAVLDWELSHIGDPANDLGWLCTRAWRFQRPDRPVGGLGSREALLEAYARESGRTISLETLEWWELLANLRWGVITIQQAFTHLSGQITSLEHAVIGRRAAEVEWDLLEIMLGPDADPRTDRYEGAESAPGPHDRPTAVELLRAAQGALGDDVLPQLEGRAKFQTRVAMRALGMVARELEHAPIDAAVRAEALAALGATDEADAAARARAGEYDADEAAALTALRELTRSKLATANPRHLSPIASPSQETA
ncbi:MAG: phosphotransferase family protein [Solirubrobacteraceae bacterium]|nr:phosphotransferase family protein [Solirubrobacteraceae bacterium]